MGRRVLVCHRVGRNKAAKTRFDAIMGCGELRPYNLIDPAAIAPHPVAVGMRILDLLAGDGGRVFLAPYTDADTHFYGFAFDLNDLLRKGALIREMDLLPAYDAQFRRMAGSLTPEEAYADPEAHRVLIAAFEYKCNAIRAKAQTKHMRTLNQGDEIVFEGAIPIQWAHMVIESDKK